MFPGLRPMVRNYSERTHDHSSRTVNVSCTDRFLADLGTRAFSENVKMHLEQSIEVQEGEEQFLQ